MSKKKKKNMKKSTQKPVKQATPTWQIILYAVLALAAIVALVLLLLNGCDGTSNAPSAETETSQEEQQPERTAEKTAGNADAIRAYFDEHPDVSECFTPGEGENLHHIEIEIRDYGTVCCELDETIAPITVANFLKLAGEGFYDGLTFHRIMDGFMIQGGDPQGDGYGGLDEKIKGEFESNGVKNELSHTRGVLSMARSTDPDSASCQFFIVQTDSAFLDGNYAAFGYVTSGIEIVDAICALTPVQDSNGTVLAQDQPVITAVRVID